MKYFIGEYSNGCSSCKEVVHLIAESYEQADEFMAAGLVDYGCWYEGCWDEDEAVDGEYWDNVKYSIREASEQEIADEDADIWISARGY